MVDWNDPDLEEKSGMLSERLLYIIVGLYGWEYVRSSNVEIALLRRQLSFRWPLLPYITARFSFLIATVLLATTTNMTIRTWIIWNTSYLLRFLLALLLLGHCTVLALCVATVRASTRNGVCMTSFVNPAYAGAVPVYSMFHDCALLVFTIVGLWRIPSSSTLWKTLVTQGVIYFVINLAANIVALVLNRLNLNPIMNNIFSIPTICICTIASSQVVLSLLRASPDDDSDSASSVKSPPLMTDFTVPQFPSVAEPEEGIRLESPQVLHGPQLSNGTRYPVLANETF